MVIVDDVQWADATSLVVLRHLAARAADMRVLLVVTFRPPEPTEELLVMAGLTSLPTTDRVELRGLSVEDVGEQLARAGAAPDRAAAVHEVTGGNPFFVGELARAMAAGAWNPGQIPPHTVLEVVRARVTRLSQTCRELLGWAAVAGREFDLELSARVSELPVERCMEVFAEACAHGIVERRDPPARMHFVHTMLRDALGASLDDPTRVGHMLRSPG